MGVGKDLREFPARLRRATGHSLRGLGAVLRLEQAFRLELLAAAVAVPTGLWLGRTGAERALLVGSCLLVLVAELLNSAVEAAVDRIGPERHELAGRAKDLGSAAVLGTIVLAALAWGLILLDR
jgi:diacylglycerol kinase (ATP)